MSRGKLDGPSEEPLLFQIPESEGSKTFLVICLRIEKLSDLRVEITEINPSVIRYSLLLQRFGNFQKKL